MQFDILSGQFGSHYFGAGVVGLKMALEAATQTANPFQFEWFTTGAVLDVTYSGSDLEAWEWLLQATYQINGGLLTLPGDECPVFFHQGALDTIYQVPATRGLGEPLTIPLTTNGMVLNQERIGQIPFKTIGLTEVIHQRAASQMLCSKNKKDKDQLKGRMDAKSWLLPNCTGGDVPVYVSPQAAIAALFSPITWGFYKISRQTRSGEWAYSTALCCPIVTGFNQWIGRKPFHPDDFEAANLADAALHYAVLNACAVHAYEYRSEQSNRSAKIIGSETVYPGQAMSYAPLREGLPNIIVPIPSGHDKIYPSAVRGMAAYNLMRGCAWYEGIVEQLGDKVFHKSYELRKLAELMGVVA